MENVSKNPRLLKILYATCKPNWKNVFEYMYRISSLLIMPFYKHQHASFNVSITIYKGKEGKAILGWAFHLFPQGFS